MKNFNSDNSDLSFESIANLWLNQRNIVINKRKCGIECTSDVLRMIDYEAILICMALEQLQEDLPPGVSLFTDLDM